MSANLSPTSPKSTKDVTGLTNYWKNSPMTKFDVFKPRSTQWIFVATPLANCPPNFGIRFSSIWKFINYFRLSVSLVRGTPSYPPRLWSLWSGDHGPGAQTSHRGHRKAFRRGLFPYGTAFRPLVRPHFRRDTKILSRTALHSARL